MGWWDWTFPRFHLKNSTALGAYSTHTTKANIQQKLPCYCPVLFIPILLYALVIITTWRRIFCDAACSYYLDVCGAQETFVCYLQGNRVGQQLITMFEQRDHINRHFGRLCYYRYPLVRVVHTRGQKAIEKTSRMYTRCIWEVRHQEAKVNIKLYLLIASQPCRHQGRNNACKGIEFTALKSNICAFAAIHWSETCP